MKAGDEGLNVFRAVLLDKTGGGGGEASECSVILSRFTTHYFSYLTLPSY